MVLKTWLSSFSTRSKEVRLASILALISFIVLISALTWSLLSSSEPTASDSTSKSKNLTVTTLERPSPMGAESMDDEPIEDTQQTQLNRLSDEAEHASQLTNNKPTNTIAPHVNNQAKAGVKTAAKPKATAAIAQKKSAASTSKINLGQGQYYVQVGAFLQAKLARLMLEKMQHKYQFAKIVDKGDKHAVWVGPVVTRKDAQNLQKYIQRKDNIQGFIVLK